MANVQVKLHAGFQVFWPLDVLFLLFLCLFRHHRLHTRIVQMYALLHALFFFFFLHARRVCCLILSLPFALRTSCPSLFFFFFLHARRVFCLCTTICICLGSSPVSSILLNVFINTVSMASLVSLECTLWEGFFWRMPKQAYTVPCRASHPRGQGAQVLCT